MNWIMYKMAYSVTLPEWRTFLYPPGSGNRRNLRLHRLELRTFLARLAIYDFELTFDKQLSSLKQQ